MVKLCVGVTEIEQLARFQKQRLKDNHRIFHITRMVPRRGKELLDGGSLYWVIRGNILVRQQMTDIEVFTDHDEIRRCRLILDPQLVPVRPVPRRAFQGWRYFTEDDAPPDLSSADAKDDIPIKMRAQLIELGLL
jgi:hypothetical protein